MTLPLLLVGHGTREPAGVDEFHAFVQRVQRLAPQIDVAGGFIELADPPITAAVASLTARGHRDVVAVPLVLVAASHSKGDVPAALLREQMRQPGLSFRYGRPLGVHPTVVSLLDRRLNVAVAAFRANYSDVQIPGSSACTLGGLPSFCGIVTNAGKAQFQGVEFEGSARLADNLMRSGDRLRLAATLGYIDAEYKEYIANIANRPTDIAEFRKVQNTPKWTASSSLGYSTPLGKGNLNLNTTVSYRSKTVQFEIPNPFIDQKGYSLWDASLVYNAPGDRWTFGIHGKNLLDKEYKTSGYTFLAVNPTTGALLTRAAATPITTCGRPRTVPAGSLIPTLGCEGVLSAYYGNPRQVFLTAGFKF